MSLLSKWGELPKSVRFMVAAAVAVLLIAMVLAFVGCDGALAPDSTSPIDEPIVQRAAPPGGEILRLGDSEYVEDIQPDASCPPGDLDDWCGVVANSYCDDFGGLLVPPIVNLQFNPGGDVIATCSAVCWDSVPTQTTACSPNPPQDPCIGVWSPECCGDTWKPGDPCWT